MSKKDLENFLLERGKSEDIELTKNNIDILLTDFELKNPIFYLWDSESRENHNYDIGQLILIKRILTFIERNYEKD
jgi:hypothetical protein